MLEYLKSYYVLMLILLVLSYLLPKEEYKKYFQFFIGVFMVVFLLQPLLQLLSVDTTKLYEVFENFDTQIDLLKWDGKEMGTIYEYFFLEGKRK